MDNVLISVIMSTYNEAEKELETSINSILGQTYSNIEFIIINDNPSNKKLCEFLYSIMDSRISILNNEKNYGLVYSLNRAWKYAKGDIIARMDADDISLNDRLEKQFYKMQVENYDLLGCCIETIDKSKKIIYFPTEDRAIRKKISWYNCIAHPTWMIKKSIYEELNGYRNIPYCEDYDFILRCIKSGYKVGNIPDIGLKYRIRKNSISNENRIDQYLLARYLAFNKNRILRLSEEDINKYYSSHKFENKRNRYISYKKNKEDIIYNKISGKNFFPILFNPYLYINILEKYMRKDIEKK